MSGSTAFIYDNKSLQYRFNDRHPFNQMRLVLTMDLLTAAGALSDSEIVGPRTADESDLLRVHNKPYIDAVKALSDPHPAPDVARLADRYGLHHGDTPFFAHMHEVTSAIVGGSIEAADRVMAGMVDHALHLGGGLHHAMPGRGAGFCVYNDAAAAIAYVREKYDARVLYVDTDVHHGDGVQFMFYSDPDVCTLSIHETGKFLFPGTGEANERGDGEGFGFCYNMPVEPYTEDASWLDCFEDMLAGVADYFRPDLIVSQHGCDAHAFDPLADIHCSMAIYREMPRRIHETAHRYCGGRWVALGGGGYDIWRVVPRAWSLLWLEMSGHPLLAELDLHPALALPSRWIETWQPQSAEKLPATWLDPVEQWEPMPRRRQIAAKNEHTKQIAKLYLPS